MYYDRKRSDAEDDLFREVLESRDLYRRRSRIVIDAIIRDHDDNHLGALRWCSRGPCEALRRLPGGLAA